jgi:hypothetical protein
MKGNALQLPTGELIAIDDTIQLEIYSPFFDREEVRLANGNRVNPQGNVSTGISRFSDGELQALLGHIDKFTVRNQPREIANVKLLSDGVVVDKGKLLIEQYDGNMNNGTGTFQLTFIAGDRDDFMEKIRDKNLRDLELCGRISIPQGNLAAWGGDVLTGSVWGSDSMTLEAVEDLKPTPSPVVYDDIFADLGKPAHAATAEYAKGIVNSGHDYFCFPTLVCYSDQTEDGYRVVNKWDVGGFFRTYTSQVNAFAGGKGNYTTYTIEDNPLVPMFYYHQVLKAIFTENGYTLNDDWLLNDTQFLKLVIVNTYNIVEAWVINMTNIGGQGVDGDTLYMEYDTNIFPRNHLPEMSQMEFLKDFMLKFNVYFEVDGTKVSIVHSELESTDREIKVLGPNYQVKIESKVGVRLAYDLSADSHKPEKNLTTPYTTLPDSSVVASLANGDLFIDKELNQIYEKGSLSNVLVCSNMVPYNTGTYKEYVMQLVPVNHKKLLWTHVYKLQDIYSSSEQGLYPFVTESVTGGRKLTVYYGFDNEVINQLGGGSAVWRAEHTYEMTDRDVQDAIEPSSIKQLGFYHGKLLTGNLLAGKQYPYMSHHNYQPDAVSPKIGDWHLGIIGEEGLKETFHAASMAMYDKGRKIYIRPDESLLQAKNHPWKNAVIVRGNKLYIAAIKNNLPWDNYPIYECWEL